MLEQMDTEFGLLRIQSSSTSTQTGSASGHDGGAEDTEEERRERIMAEDRVTVNAVIRKSFPPATKQRR